MYSRPKGPIIVSQIFMVSSSSTGRSLRCSLSLSSYPTGIHCLDGVHWAGTFLETPYPLETRMDQQAIFSSAGLVQSYTGRSSFPSVPCRGNSQLPVPVEFLEITSSFFEPDHTQRCRYDGKAAAFLCSLPHQRTFSGFCRAFASTPPESLSYGGYRGYTALARR